MRTSPSDLARSDDTGRDVTPSKAAGWYAVAVCLLLYLFSQTDRQIISLLVTPIQTELAIGDFRMGLLMGPAFGLCYAVAALPLAWLADRYNRRAIVCVSVLVWAAAACASGLAASFQSLFAARMLVGIGEAALLPSSYVIVSALFPRHRLAIALSVLSMGSVGGLALAFGLGGWLTQIAGQFGPLPLLGKLAPWRLMFILTGAPCLVLAFLYLTIRDNTAAQRASVAAFSGNAWQFMRANRQIAMGVLVGFGLVSLCSSAFASWVPTYLQRAFGWSIARAGLSLGVVTLGVATVGKIGSGLIVDRLYSRGIDDVHLRYLMVMAVLAAPLVALAFALPLALPFLLISSSYFLLPYANMGYGSAFVQLVTPIELRGQVSAIFLFAMNVLAMGVGPALVGWLSERLHGDLGLAIAIVVVTLLPVAAMALWRALPAARLLVGTIR